MPKVSVVIPCFNHGRYVDEAVDSILQQTFQDFEIIVVNDGSTDQGTVEKLRSYAKPKTVVLHTANGGPSAARNRGIRASSGIYVLPLDADDRFENSFLEKAVDILDRQPGVGMVTCGRQCFGASDKRFIPEGGGVRSCLDAAMLNMLFRRVCWEHVGGYDEDPRMEYEDWDFGLAVTERGWKIEVVPEYLFFYRVHTASRRTRAHERRPENVRRIVQKHREVFAQNVEEVVVKREMKIRKLRQELHAMRDGWRIRAATMVLRPVAWFRSLLRPDDPGP